MLGGGPGRESASLADAPPQGHAPAGRVMHHAPAAVSESVDASSSASGVLASRLHDLRAIKSLARLAVPAFADCCMIDLIEADGQPRRLHAVCADPAKQAIVDDLARRYSPRADRPAELAAVVQTGASRLFADIPERFWETIAEDPDHLHRLRALAFRSMMIVPIVVGEQTLGTLHFLTGASGRRYGVEDVRVAEDLAHQVALAVDNVRLRRQLRKVEAAAEAASRAKDDFLAMLSHEMRSPLGAITIWASLLRMGKLPKVKMARAIEAIDRQASILSRFIEELLDMSRIVGGKLALDVRSVDLAAVAESALDTVRGAADAKELRLEMQIDSSERVPGDSTRLQQVISNLLSNAVKFSARGGRVLLSVAAEGSHAVITVRDVGEGIGSDFLPHVFERFRQASEKGARVHGGLGLGLAIVREIVELHHGTVNAESAGRGQGSTFTVTLPFVESAEALHLDRTVLGAGESRSRTPSMLAGVRVLVVEADPEVQAALVVALELNGASVTATASAAEAVNHLAREHPDVLVTDITPSEDGFALIRQIRNLTPEHGGRIRAVALTGHAVTHEVDRVIGAGYQLHLVKPVDPSALVAAVAKLAVAAEGNAGAR
jgi:signal transduction histidine kinase/ActR/RegA family two-component response regulator